MLSSTAQLAVVLACVAASCYAQGNYLEDEDYALPSRPAYRPPARPAPQPVTAKPTPPVAIIKQINRHNEDGSYTYGYEGGDGSFKIETKLTTGEVMGKYGYVDDVGKVRVVEYGANKYGFMPQGEGITVAPPTLVDETTSKEALQEQQREQQRSRLYLDDDRVRYQEEERPRLAPRPAPAPRPVFVPEERPQPVYRPAPAPQPAPYKPVSYKPAAPAYRPPQKSAAPVPPRPVIQGAAPVQAHRPAAPVYEENLRPAPQPAYRAPPPPPPQQPARDTYAHARFSPSILDQLEKDYALPSSSGSRYHDVSFGSF